MKPSTARFALLAGLLLCAPALLAEEPPVAADAAAFDVAAATEAYLARLTPEQRERSDSYFEGGYWLQLWGFLYGIGVAWLLLGSGLSARMRDLAGRIGRWRPLANAIYWLQYLLATTVLGLPLAIYQGYFREHQYGLSNQSFGEWSRDQLMALGVGSVLGGLAIATLYAVFRRAPRTWHAWGAAVAILFTVVLIVIGPVYIAPLFNDYSLLEDPALRDPILSMARANGVDVDRVYQFDASKQSKRISANVSGLGHTMRISLNDNLLKRCNGAEIQSVMGHELGHYVLNHIYEGVIYLAVVLYLGFAFVRWTFDACVRRWGGRWGVDGIADVAGLPLLVALLSLYSFLLTPISNTLTRTDEAEADAFGLNAAREPDGFASTAILLSEYRKLDPGPLEEWLFYDHPSGRARVTMAMRWKAEHLAESAPVAAGPPATD